MSEGQIENPNPVSATAEHRPLGPVRGNTFDPIALDWRKLSQPGDFGQFIESLYQAVENLKNKRLEYYSRQRVRRAIVNKLRSVMVWLGISALLATSFAAGVRASGAENSYLIASGNGMLGFALACYVVMSALSFWETATSSTAAYFRQIQLILGIRDLWTRFEFDLVAALRSQQVGQIDENATRSAALDLARTLVTSIDGLAQGELNDWKQEILTSLSSLNNAGRDGIEHIRSEIRGLVQDNNSRLQLGYVSLSVDGASAPLTVTIDEMASIPQQSLNFTLPPLTQGPHRIHLSAKDSAGQDIQSSCYIQVSPGVSSFSISMGSGTFSAR